MTRPGKATPKAKQGKSRRDPSSEPHCRVVNQDWSSRSFRTGRWAPVGPWMPQNPIALPRTWQHPQNHAEVPPKDTVPLQTPPASVRPLRWTGRGCSPEEIWGDFRTLWLWGWDGAGRRDGSKPRVIPGYLDGCQPSLSILLTANRLGTIGSAKLGWKGDAELGIAHPGVSEQPELFQFAVF